MDVVREDMSKIIVERPRAGGAHDHKGRPPHVLWGWMGFGLATFLGDDDLLVQKDNPYEPTAGLTSISA